ncbi:hypothetical protein Unana1_05569 [Umbelopsis nana]
MTVINWVNTWLTKDGQSDIVTNDISQDEQDGWVHLDVTPHITVLEDDTMNPLGDSVVNVVSVDGQVLSLSNEPAIKEDVEPAKERLAVTEDTPTSCGDKENVAINQAAVDNGSVPERKMSRQERRYAERKNKKMIIKNVKAARSLQQNCASVARSVAMV